MITNESTIAHDIKHLAERYYYEDRKRGKRNDTALAFVAGAMILIGAQIFMDIYKRGGITR